MDFYTEALPLYREGTEVVNTEGTEGTEGWPMLRMDQPGILLR